MTERVPCPHCKRTFPDRPAVYQHIRAKHGGKGKNAYRHAREPSLADDVVALQIRRSMGETLDEAELALLEGIL